MVGFDTQLPELGGKPVVTFDPDVGIQSTECCYRLEGYDEMPIWEVMNAFAAHPLAADITALVIGDWNVREVEGKEAVAALIAVADRMPRLAELMFGDVLHEEARLSWLDLGCITPMIHAFGELRELCVRGCADLSGLRHPQLQALVLQTQALRPGDIRAIYGAVIPCLRHLELWIGTDEHGAASASELRPLLQRNPFESLEMLGLRNAQTTDDVAAMMRLGQPFDLRGANVLALGVAGFTRVELRSALRSVDASLAKRGPRREYSYGLTKSTDLVVIGDACPFWERNNFMELAGAQGVTVITEIELRALLNDEHRRSVFDHLHTLDLSLGTLTDVGAEALLAHPTLEQLDVLDIHHHYVSDELCAQLAERVTSLDASARQPPTSTPVPALLS